MVLSARETTYSDLRSFRGPGGLGNLDGPGGIRNLYGPDEIV